MIRLAVHDLRGQADDLLQAVAPARDRPERIFRIQTSARQRRPGRIAFGSEKLRRVGDPDVGQGPRAFPEQRAVASGGILPGRLAHLAQRPAGNSRGVHRGPERHIDRAGDLHHGLLADQRGRSPAAEGRDLHARQGALDGQDEAARQLAGREVVALLRIADALQRVRQPDAAERQIDRHGVRRHGGGFDPPFLVLAGVAADQRHAWREGDLPHAQADQAVGDIGRQLPPACALHGRGA